MHFPRVLVLMGVSGCGKTHVGRLLAERMDFPFYDGDDYHPEENVARMSRSIPLTDAHRKPWMDRLRRAIILPAPGGTTTVLACSALKQRYRDWLRCGDSDVLFVFMQGSRELIRQRLEDRKGHFMKASLLESQFETLEAPGPEESITVPVEDTPENIVDAILAELAARTSEDP